MSKVIVLLRCDLCGRPVTKKQALVLPRQPLDHLLAQGDQVHEHAAAGSQGPQSLLQEAHPHLQVAHALLGVGHAGSPPAPGR